MKFYHGTYMQIGKIDLGKSRNRVDFGKGFYLTSKFETARDWAVRKVEIEGEGVPTVYQYEIDPDIYKYKLDGLRFKNTPEIEWLEFICSNRRINSTQNFKAKEPRHDKNWVAGPIADDKVVDVVAEYMRAEITAKDAIRRLRVLPQTFQLSLHTPAALAYVNDTEAQYKELRGGRWTQGWKKRGKS